MQLCVVSAMVRAAPEVLGVQGGVPDCSHGHELVELFQLKVKEIISNQCTLSRGGGGERPKVDLGCQAQLDLGISHQESLSLHPRCNFFLLTSFQGRLALLVAKCLTIAPG